MGAAIIKYFENIFSAINKTQLGQIFDFLPQPLTDVMVSLSAMFVGEGWHLTLGVLFMLVVIFLPGGLMEGIRRISDWTRRRGERPGRDVAGGAVRQPSE